MPRPEPRNRDAAAQPPAQIADRRRQRLRRVRTEHSNHERWLVSYADFVTLLFAFFTTLYAMSHVDTQKLTAMVSSLHIAFDAKAANSLQHKLGLNQQLPVAGDDVLGRNPKPAGQGGPTGHEMSLSDVRAALTRELQGAIQNKLLDIQRDPRGLVISIREAGSFPTGSADLSAEANTVLLQIGHTLNEVGNQVRVEGHTDDVPIHTAKFSSNWQLSTTRATNVVEFLIGQAGLSPSRISAAGYAEFRPRVPNTNDANRALNRRVDIVILNPSTTKAEEPGKAHD